MIELQKESVIYICSISLDILSKDISREEKFKELVQILEKEAGIVLAFCEIIVSRWKFLAGSDNFSSPTYKYSRENSNFGILVQDWGLLDKECSELIDLIFNNIL